MGTIFVLAVLAGIVALVIRSMIRDRKAGKSLQCGGDCKFCGGYCHQAGPGDPVKKGGNAAASGISAGSEGGGSNG